MPENAQTASESEDSSLQSLATTFSRVLGSLTGLLSALVAVLSHVLYVLFVSIFFAAGAETYINGVVKLVPKAHRPHAREVLRQLYKTLQAWFVGRLLSMVIVGTLIGLGLWLLGVPFAFGLGFITFLFEFIPTIGPWLAGIPAVLVALTQGGSAALWVAVLFLVLELLEGNVLLPLVQRRMIELPPALLLFSIFLMGTLFGFVGVLIAAPLVAVLLVLVKMLYVQDTLGDETELPGSS